MQRPDGLQTGGVTSYCTSALTTPDYAGAALENAEARRGTKPESTKAHKIDSKIKLLSPPS